MRRRPFSTLLVGTLAITIVALFLYSSWVKAQTEGQTVFLPSIVGGGGSASVPSTPDMFATETAIAYAVSTSVMATLEAQPQATSETTPNILATQTAVAEVIIRNIAATLTAQPSPTAIDTPNIPGIQTMTAQPLETPAVPDINATETAISESIVYGVAATLTAQPTQTATPTLDVLATQTAIIKRVATYVAATLTAQPTPTATSTPTNTPTATPTFNIPATQTAISRRVATYVAATLTAQPTSTSTTSTTTLTPKVTHTPTPTVTHTPTPLWSVPKVIAGNHLPGEYAGINAVNSIVVDSEQSILIGYALNHIDNGASGNDEVFIRKNIRGQGWQSPVKLSNVTVGQLAGAPTLLVSRSGVLHASWLELTWGGDGGFQAKYSYRQGSTNWYSPTLVVSLQATEPLSTVTPLDNQFTHILAEASATTVGIVWRGETPEGFSTFWTAQISPTLWTDPVTVSTGSEPTAGPAAINDTLGNVHIVWTEASNIRLHKYSYSAPSVLSWSVPITVPLGGGPLVLSLYSDLNNTLHLLGQDSYGLLYRTKPPQAGWGDSYEETEILPLSGSYIGNFQGTSTLAVDNSGSVHVVWFEGRKIRYLEKEDGLIWSDPETIFDRRLASQGPIVVELVVDHEQKLHLVWAEDGQVWYSTTNPLYR